MRKLHLVLNLKGTKDVSSSEVFFLLLHFRYKALDLGQLWKTLCSVTKSKVKVSFS